MELVSMAVLPPNSSVSFTTAEYILRARLAKSRK
jgi:hypothetical protein